MRKNTMTKTMLKNKLKSLQSLPKGLKKNVDMGFVDEYSDDKYMIFVKHATILYIKNLPLDKTKNNQLKKKLLPIHSEVRQLANPKLHLKTKRRLLKKLQVGNGIFTALASFVIPTLISMLASK